MLGAELLDGGGLEADFFESVPDLLDLDGLFKAVFLEDAAGEIDSEPFTNMHGREEEAARDSRGGKNVKKNADPDKIDVRRTGQERHHPEPLDRAPADQDIGDNACHENTRKEAADEADDEGHRKAAYRPRAQLEQDEGGDKSRQMRVEDGAEREAVAGRHGGGP